ncbi:MAG: dTDP-4-dehydrorhamnose 3,5-epimerase [Chitinispirillaceae bacterium]|nr:dTDP-4-dehydrorhamnose 3,5-epimerase [Chitinispirillaceae bacterium]
MEFIATDISDLYVLQPKVHGDHRGFFLESYSKEVFDKAGIAATFIQDNHSCSASTGVLRGLHFQKPPFAQTKLIRVTRGSILDVAVDLRKDSPTFMQWRSFELTEDNFTMLLVPAGFAHGFCTTAPDTHVQYKVDAPYAPESDSGIRWNDPQIGVAWPITEPVLSVKDAGLPFLKDNPSPF